MMYFPGPFQQKNDEPEAGKVLQTETGDGEPL